MPNVVLEEAMCPACWETRATCDVHTPPRPSLAWDWVEAMLGRGTRPRLRTQRTTVLRHLRFRTRRTTHDARRTAHDDSGYDASEETNERQR